MTLLVVFCVTYIAISLMFAAKPKRLAANIKYFPNFPLSGKILHGIAWCLFLVSVYLISMQNGWETGIPIWLSLLMVTAVLVVTLSTLYPKSWIAILMINCVIIVMAFIGLTQ